LWEADLPQRPDPYLANIDLSAIGAGIDVSSSEMRKRPTHLRIVK
jgi:urea transport system substrate-binding protein